MGKLGGLAVLNLEGIQTKYADPGPALDAIASFDKEEATEKMQQIYAAEDVKAELVTKRIKEIKAGGVLAAASLTPQNVERFIGPAMDGGLDILVIQGTVVSAEHVSSYDKPLDLNAFVESLDIPCIIGGCCSYQGALHLMRSGAVGVLVGVGPGHACTSRRVLGIGVPQATAIADASAARTRHLEETGRYAHIIADGGMRTGGDIAKAIAVGADACMIGSPLASASEAPGRGYHWGMATFHPDLPRGTRVRAGIRGTLEDILVGPAHQNDGTLNLLGGLRTSMSTCGYENLKTFQKAEVMVAPSLQTEGKVLQNTQGVGMGR
jgi:IMP dehydrogenase